MAGKVSLGDHAKDTVTGFQGVIVGHATYMTAAPQFMLQPPVKDGAWVDARWFDAARVVAVPHHGAPVGFWLGPDDK